MLVSDRSRGRRAGTFASALTLAVLAGCSPDDPVTAPDVTGPGQSPRPDRAEALASPGSDLNVQPLAGSRYAAGYAWANQSTSPSYTPSASYSFNVSGKGVTITRQGVGTYTVRFAGLSALLGGASTVHVTGYGADFTYCKPAAQKLQSDAIQVTCQNAGQPVDALYTVYVARKRDDLAFAYANNPTATGAYTPPAGASFNPTGAIQVLRQGLGSYLVSFKGLTSRLTTNRGHAQAVAIATGGAYCVVTRWTGTPPVDPDVHVFVDCHKRDGTPKDMKFNVLFAMPAPSLGYAFANQPAVATYSPSALVRFVPNGGAVTVTRSAIGRYTVTWSGLSLLDGGDVQVTAVGPGISSNIVCKVEGWSFLFTTNARVRCFDPATNALRDSGFTIMFFS